MDRIKLTRSAEMPEVRGMTRGQVKEFNSKGFNPLRNKTALGLQLQADTDQANTVANVLLVAELNDNSEGYILDTVYPDYDFDDADSRACSQLCAGTFARTFAPEESEIKNSQTPGTGKPESVVNTAETV